MPPSFYYRQTDDKSLRGEPYPPLPSSPASSYCRTQNQLRMRCMSSTRQRAVKGTEPKVSRNEGWNVLSWDDLTEWAGSRSVERGRADEREGRGRDLARR